MGWQWEERRSSASISISNNRQKVVLSNEETISARLVIIANGLNVGLRHMLGIERHVHSACHSISIGFDVVPLGRKAFRFPALTYFSERPSDRIPYISLFPIGTTMRANLFVYRDFDDPWLREFRRAPVETLTASLPRLKRITGAFAVSGDVRIRPVDLCANTGYRRAGVVLVGDAFETTCPVSGTGTDKVFTDVERLCNVHIPEWLATDGMDESKIAASYDDPVKRACDEWAMEKAYSFRAVSIDPDFHGALARWARFLTWYGRGLWRRQTERWHASGPIPTFASRRSENFSRMLESKDR
jgi:2-polyprenyl-6-methoxyphenol hydroxylase and related FAD-dependent oxidoreductases